MVFEWSQIDTLQTDRNFLLYIYIDLGMLCDLLVKAPKQISWKNEFVEKILYKFIPNMV